jgi:alpha-beta hydrolase superfamily lysophospholipase
MAYAVVLSFAVLILVGLHLVAGWLYASGFRDTALTPRKPRRDYGIWVRMASKDTIVLTAKEARQDIGHPGVSGLYWEGGYGRVGELRRVENDEVTRDFEPMVGTPPICRDSLDSCDQVDLDPYTFESDPLDVGLSFAEVSYDSPLGPMSAWVVPSAGGSTWAIHVHGWTATRQEAIRLLPEIHRRGLTSMVIDYRNDADAPEDPSGRYRFGITEWEDVEAAVIYANQHGATDLVLVGYSTGGAHVLSFLERSAFADQVKATVLDSPNIILAETVRAGSMGLKLGSTPIPLTRLMTEFGMWIIDLRWSIDWDVTNYVQRSESILTMPTLVFHGTSDHRVPISISRQLEVRCPETVTLIECQAAGHVMSWNADPDRYERQLGRFLASVQN